MKSPAWSHSREVVGAGLELKQSDSRARVLKRWAALLPGEISGLQARGPDFRPNPGCHWPGHLEQIASSL